MFLASPVPDYPKRFDASSLFDAPRTGHRHGGLDLMARRTSQLVSPERGSIERIYVSTAGGGGSIWIDHGDLPAFADPTVLDAPGRTKTKHQHIALDDDGKPLYLVAEGDGVSKRQPFAIAGDSGNAGAVHDHYEVHVDGKRIDPRQVTWESAVRYDGAPVTFARGFLEQWHERGLLPGPYSRLLQLYLVWWGYSLVVDGVMGPLTGAALRQFQRRRNLTVDAIAGPQTWAAIEPAVLL